MSVSTAQHQRPSLLGSDVSRFWNLVFTLAVTDFKLKYYGSVLGYVWTLARPFLFFGVIYFVFTEIVGLDKNVPNYGVYILFALVLFQFFGEVTGNCLGSLVARESMLRKMRFPRLVIPLSVVLTALFNLGMTLIAVFIFAIASGVTPTWGWLELPVIIVLLTIFASGCGLVLSALFVRYRDVQPIWDVTSQVLFYASPILYVATMVPESYQRAYLANPISALLTEMRHAVVDPTARPVWDAIGGAERLLVPGGIVVAVFLLGLWVFTREAPRIAENL
ncbi:MAG TPA: ABC transporter permease [Solirubrobacteraceae bacterium]|nr:ABC transporter permease [Solirubrobacteraceae bacterium]